MNKWQTKDIQIKSEKLRETTYDVIDRVQGRSSQNMPLWHIGYWIKVTKSWLVQEKCWPSPVPLKTINKLTMWKTPFLYRKVERDLHHQRYGIKVCKGCINSRMVSLLSYYAQAQTSFSCHFLTNTLFLCLKAIKIICFGLFFESHISMISYIYKIWVCFFLLLIYLVSI